MVEAAVFLASTIVLLNFVLGQQSFGKSNNEKA